MRLLENIKHAIARPKQHKTTGKLSNRTAIGIDMNQHSIKMVQLSGRSLNQIQLEKYVITKLPKNVIKGNRIGVKFGYNGTTTSGQNAWGSSLSTAGTGSTGLTSSPNINLPVTSATGSIALVRSWASGALGLELSASEELSKSKTISNPRVLTQDRKEATIESGTEIPYQEASSSGSTSVSYKKAVLGLTVTPNITPDGQIIMSVKVNKDTPQECTVDSLSTMCISTKNLTTQAMVEDGGTLIIGGIYEEENANSNYKVPLLGDIPVLGNLFKSRSRSETRRELLVFITPRIMDNMGNNLRY